MNQQKIVNYREITFSFFILGMSIIGSMTWANDTSQTAASKHYQLTWTSIDGGGIMVARSDTYRMANTIGQADAGAADDGVGANEMTTGFWSVAAIYISRDDFESGDLSGWSSVVGQKGDSNSSGQVNISIGTSGPSISKVKNKGE